MDTYGSINVYDFSQFHLLLILDGNQSIEIFNEEKAISKLKVQTGKGEKISRSSLQKR